MLDALLKDFYNALDQVKEIGSDILGEFPLPEEYSGPDDIEVECAMVEDILNAIEKITG